MRIIKQTEKGLPIWQITEGNDNIGCVVWLPEIDDYVLVTNCSEYPFGWLKTIMKGIEDEQKNIQC